MLRGDRDEEVFVVNDALEPEKENQNQDTLSEFYNEIVMHDLELFPPIQNDYHDENEGLISLESMVSGKQSDPDFMLDNVCINSLSSKSDSDFLLSDRSDMTLQPQEHSVQQVVAHQNDEKQLNEREFPVNTSKIDGIFAPIPKQNHFPQLLEINDVIKVKIKNICKHRLRMDTKALKTSLEEKNQLSDFSKKLQTIKENYLKRIGKGEIFKGVTTYFNLGYDGKAIIAIIKNYIKQYCPDFVRYVKRKAVAEEEQEEEQTTQPKGKRRRLEVSHSSREIFSSESGSVNNDNSAGSAFNRTNKNRRRKKKTEKKYRSLRKEILLVVTRRLSSGIDQQDKSNKQKVEEYKEVLRGELRNPQSETRKKMISRFINRGLSTETIISLIEDKITSYRPVKHRNIRIVMFAEIPNNQPVYRKLENDKHEQSNITKKCSRYISLNLRRSIPKKLRENPHLISEENANEFYANLQNIKKNIIDSVRGNRIMPSLVPHFKMGYSREEVIEHVLYSVNLYKSSSMSLVFKHYNCGSVIRVEGHDLSQNQVLPETNTPHVVSQQSTVTTLPFEVPRTQISLESCKRWLFFSQQTPLKESGRNIALTEEIPQNNKREFK